MTCLCYRYSNYKFISDNKISQSAGTGTRYSLNSLFGVIFDIQILAETDFLVCTFSSQVIIVSIVLYVSYTLVGGLVDCRRESGLSQTDCPWLEKKLVAQN